NAPSQSELKEILFRTTGASNNECSCVIPKEKSNAVIQAMKAFARTVLVAPPVEDLLVGTIFSLSPESTIASTMAKEYVRFGPGPRAAQALLLSAKIKAILDNRMNVAFEDITSVMIPALRHRLILNYQAEAEGIS